MSVRNDILNQLATDLALINGTGAYTTTIQSIKRGIYDIKDFDTFPALSFWCRNDDVEQYVFGGNKLRWLSVYMFAYTKGDGEILAIHEFEDDVEYLLDNDFTYSDDVLIENTVIYEKGTLEATEDAAMFLLNFRLKYES